MISRRNVRLLAAAPALLAFHLLPAPAQVTTERVSVSSDGAQANDDCSAPIAMSADGRYVVFSSYATNLVPNDTNGSADVFLRDRRMGTTERVSVNTAGDQVNGSSSYPAISADGTVIVFASYATNLVEGDTNGKRDIFLRDRKTSSTVRISVSSAGTQGNSESTAPVVNAEGTAVAFSSFSTNLVSGDTNYASDVFLRIPGQLLTERVSVAGNGSQANGNSFAPSLDETGGFIAFYSEASNLFAGDTNGKTDVFLRIRAAGLTEHISVALGAAPANEYSVSPKVSPDSWYVAFASAASNLVEGDTTGFCRVFVRDRYHAATLGASYATGGAAADNSCEHVSISNAAKYVAFWSGATNLCANDNNHCNDIFVRNMDAHTTERVSLCADGTEAANASVLPVISGDGTAVAFISNAYNLVPGSTNSREQIYVRGPSMAVRPFTETDIRQCLGVISGLATASVSNVSRLNVVGLDSVVDMRDAATIARKVAGLAPNP